MVEFGGYNKVICTRARLLRLVEDPFPENNSGNYNVGNYNSGYGNSSDCNFGDMNLGNWNSRYFCTNFLGFIQEISCNLLH